MGHLDAGLIRAFQDGEMREGSEGLEAHLATCPQCAQEAREQDEALTTLSGALSLLDTPPPMERARARILRLEQEKRNPWQQVRRKLPRAASFAILLSVGAAAALPGSPVRQWVLQEWVALFGDGPVTTLPSPEAVDALPAGAQNPELVGATLPLTDGGVELRIEGLVEGAEIRVLLTEGDRVGIFAGKGTGFRTEAGLLEARGAPGGITVELPRDAPLMELLVDGVVFLRKRAGEMELLGPVKSRTPSEIRFGPPPLDPQPQPSRR